MRRYGSRTREVIYVDPAIAKRVAQLAARHRASKAEVYRLAIEAGFRHIRPALKRLERSRPPTYRAARGGGSSASAPASVTVSELGTHDQLLAYGNMYLSLFDAPDRDVLYAALLAHAEALGLDDDDLESMIESVLNAVSGAGGGEPIISDDDDPPLPGD